ncbi:unnamed protein product [Spirodela intermedia]|uniref:Calcineurin-like phosphoesterase domain-containing protein n=1 Tax=Spirodela intermedia TaxID=51605 RepID=A0ABN7EAE8_SPIIN|nr:unnamed protein product [Spirodela intermedia]
MTTGRHSRPAEPRSPGDRWALDLHEIFHFGRRRPLSLSLLSLSLSLCVSSSSLTRRLSWGYWTDPDGIHYDSRGVAPREKYVANTLKGFSGEVEVRRWPPRHPSVSVHGDTMELVKQLLPVLKANGVDLYINGHDHCLEHISSNDSPIHFLTSGAGSKAWRGIYTPNTDKLRFFYDGQGSWPWS